LRAPSSPVRAAHLEHRLGAVVHRVRRVRAAEASVALVTLHDVVGGAFCEFASVLPAAQFEAQQAHADAAG